MHNPYVIRLTFNNMEKRLFFENLEHSTREKFNELLKSIKDLKNTATSLDDYCKKVIAMFAENNFAQIHH